MPWKSTTGNSFPILLIITVSFLIPLAFSLLYPSFLGSFESKLQDEFFRLRYSLTGREAISPYVVHIVLDDESLAYIDGSTTERVTYARLIRAIGESGAKLIACDVLFANASSPENDTPLIEAVESVGNVYLPIVLHNGKLSENAEPGYLRESAASSKVFWSPATRIGGTPPEADRITAPFAALFDAAAGAGHINCNPDADGINRRFALVYRYGASLIPALPLRMICDYLSVDARNAEIAFGRNLTLRDAVLPGKQVKDIVIPIDNAGRLVINYPSPWRKSFYTISVKDFLSAAAGNDNLALNLSDVLENSIVLISDTSARNKDVGPGIFDDLIPYSEILVNVADTMLTGNFVRSLPRYGLPLLLIGFILIFWFTSLFPELFLRIVSAFCIIAIYLVASVFLFLFARVLIPLGVPITGFVLYVISGSVYWAHRSDLAVAAYRNDLARMKNESQRTTGNYKYPEPPMMIGPDSEILPGSDAGLVDDQPDNASKFRTGNGERRKRTEGTLKFPAAFDKIVTGNRAMIRIFFEIEAYKGSDSPILIVGETGVGKELIAQAIHAVSGRSGKYVTVNVAGIDDQLFNDTLFGHKRGAYTGAEKDESGFVEVAKGGTLFLDEIGDLSMASQVKLLRLIENKEYYPLNSKIPLKADVRIIAATNADIDEKVRNKAFREDFARRLGLRLSIPPLRERPEDIKPLLDHFIAGLSEKMGKPIPGYPPDLIRLLESYRFPGNIRELENMVEEAVSKNEADTLSLSVFRERILKEGRIGEATIIDSNRRLKAFAFKGSLTELLEEIETAYIRDALNATVGNRRKAAKLLGVNYDWLKRRVKGGSTE